MRFRLLAPALLLVLPLSACKTASKAADGVKSAGEAVASGVGGVATSLVNVNLSNVLNDLAVQLKVDRANIPINAQIPITIAANVCGVSINILSVGAGGGNSGGCTAKTTSGDLAQAVQQQMSAGSTATPATSTPATTSPATTSPATTTPSTTAPSTTAPSTTAPSTTAPSTTTPGSTTPATAQDPPGATG